MRQAAAVRDRRGVPAGRVGRASRPPAWRVWSRR